ncbi:hypothetical protein HPB50_000509 [Hyalomma asiaticum]|uniref:Uncharacterized protein n=1 Tax=Hyalomma asiaticum TaxID=266040 RepID=A0ACB7T308_HYAAI|nr:hypothetical protein HPB50_000509 [Hyalomma asiaticum]
MRRCATTFLPLLLVTACVAQKLLTLEECKDKSPGFKNVTISPCDTDPCALKRGENYNVTFYAEAPESSDFLMVTTVDEQQTEVTSIQSAHSISCQFLDIPCNVTKGEVFRGGRGVPGFQNFTISPCDSDPCVITRGEIYNVTFFAEATTDANVVMLSTSVHQQSNVTLIQISQTVSCHFRDFPCNVTRGDIFRGSYNFRIGFGTFAPEEATYWVQIGTYRALFACGQAKLIIE